MADDLVQTLLATRDDYDRDRDFFVFLLDSYDGSGGYEGSIRASTTAWAEQLAAECSTEKNRRSYLDQHPREQDEKFTRRRELAVYSNYVAPIIELLNGFMLARDFDRGELPERLQKWVKDVDGTGTSLDDARANMSLRAFIFGWAPSVVDMPQIDPAAAPMNLAQAEQVGFRPRLVLLFGTHLTEWQIPQGRKGFVWAKTRVSRVEREDMFDKPINVTRVTYWKDKTVQWWDIVDNKIVKESGVVRHSFGAVPISICRVKTALDGEVKGSSPSKQISFANRRLFNVENEMDEHIRSQVFALLAIPVTRDPATGAVEEPPDDLTLGSENGIYYPADSQGDPFFLAPPAEIAKTLQGRIDSIVREIYRQAGVDFVKPQADDQSGVARKYAFANTNRKLRDMAKEIARWETDVLQKAARALSISEDEVQKLHVEPPLSFDVEELSELLTNTLDAISVQIGETATALLRNKVAKAVLGGRLTAAQAEAIDEEIKALGAQESASRAAGAAGRGAGSNGMLGGKGKQPPPPPPGAKGQQPEPPPPGDE